MGTLYLVPTPIGNLSDITLRALRILFAVDVIACEDTRRTGLLLEKLLEQFSSNPEDKHKPKLLSYYDQIELQRIPEIISMLKSNLDVALVSDAGTPEISDPGFKLVRESIKEELKVISLPGASSVMTALTVSGLPTDKFLFVGYPPHKPGHRVTFFKNLKTSLETIHATVIFFEAPHKLLKTLSDVYSVFGSIDLVVCRELTKVYEEVRRENILSFVEHIKKNPPKGEFVLLFHI
jgi:16S rRNA (cytidine1402-2'-O)-methyltransferase